MKKSKKQIIQVAAKNGLDIIEDSLKFNESGLDFLVVYAAGKNGKKWVLRIPRRSDAMASSAKEKKILDLVAPFVSVQVPRWEVFTEDLIAYKLLDGIPAGTIDAAAKKYIWEIDPGNVPKRFNKTLAEALVSLHRIIPDEIDGLHVENVKNMRELLSERMNAVKSVFDINPSLWKRWQDWLADDEFWPQQTGLIHGDLHAGHILINQKSEVTGFIDWTEAAVSDTAADFVAHYRTFGEKALRSLIFHYQNAGGIVWPKMAGHVAERAAAYPVEIAEFALKSGLDEYMQMAQSVLNPKE